MMSKAGIFGIIIGGSCDHPSHQAQFVVSMLFFCYICWFLWDYNFHFLSWFLFYFFSWNHSLIYLGIITYTFIFSDHPMRTAHFQNLRAACRPLVSEKYFEQQTQHGPPISRAQGEVAFLSRSGACLCGRPPQCGAAAAAADAAVSLLFQWMQVEMRQSTRKIHRKHSSGTFTIKAPSDTYQCRGV